MPTTRKKTTGTRSSSSRTKRGTGSRKATSTRPRRSTATRRTSSGRLTRKGSRTPRSSGSARTVAGTNPERLPSSSLTFTFECTQQGCGYRIYREEKAERGQLRFDIKCPKCHNEEFRCLGKGDYPEDFTAQIAGPSEIDFGQNSPVGVDSD